MTETLVMVLAHTGAQAVFDRHLPLWEAHRQNILVCCPMDAPVKTRHDQYLYGKSENAGPNTTVRWDKFLVHALCLNYAYYAVFEYDSFALDVDLRLIPGFQCTIGHNSHPEFTAPNYPIAPWIIDRESLRKVLSANPELKTEAEGQVYDRLMGLRAMTVGVPLIPHHDGQQFARNTINLKDDKEPLDAWLAAGARTIHGVKTKDVLDYILAKK